MHSTGLNISIFTFELDYQVIVITEDDFFIAAGTELY